MNKSVLTSFTILCLLSTMFLMEIEICVKGSPDLPVHNIDTGLNYTTIQMAIDASETLDGHTIFVDEGIYYENIIVSKSLSLVGERRISTIIDSNGRTTINIQCPYVNMSGFTLRNSTSSRQFSEVYGCGIYLGKSAVHTRVCQNEVSNSSCAIFLDRSGDASYAYNNISDNYLNSGGLGICLNNSTGNVIQENSIQRFSFPFIAGGDSPSKYVNNIQNNRINGRLLYYVMNEQYLIADPLNFPDAGFLFFVNSSYIDFRDLELSTLWLAFIENSTVLNLRTNWIVVDGCRNNVIQNSTIEDIPFAQGISLTRSSNNIVKLNKVRNCTVAVGLYRSRNNLIYHNNFINNTRQVETDSWVNMWDNGYPSGGNYWSDYNGTDSDGDGIGDTPYIIDENNVDRYPLVETWMSQVVIVDPFYGEIGFFKDLLYKVEDYLADVGYATSIVKNDNVTVEWLRHGLNHGVVLWRGHSVQFPSGIGLLTGEVVTEENTLMYEEDIVNGRIGSISKGDIDYWAIRPEFIEHYYTSSKLEYSLVVVEGCSSLSDTSLANVFIDVGAGSYVGYTIEVQEPLTSLDMLTLFKNLCEKGYTVEKAVESVFWGRNLLKYHGDPDLRLTTRTDTIPSIAFELQSPAYLYVTDPEGNHIGLDPVANKPVNDVIEAIYTGPETEPQIIWIPNAINGTYEILLIGNAAGIYNLTVGVSSLLKTNTTSEHGTITTDQTIIYFATLSGNDVIVIPEFPSFLILPLFMIATLLAVIVCKRKHSILSKKHSS